MGITIHTSSFPFRDQVIPQVYNSNRISHKEAFKMITKGLKLQRKNIPGLTYHPDQAPSGSRDFPKNNNWKTVIRPPTETSKTPFVFKIEIRNPAKGKKLGTLLSVVLVKFLSEDGVPPRVRNASTYFLNTHSNVRVTDHETGVMVPIGERYDPRSYRNVNYQTCSKKQKQCQQFVLSEREQHLSLLDFNELFLKSSIWFAQSLCSSINNLKAHNHVLKVTRDEVKFSLLPTYMCSSSLHNSVHIDASDFTASFSIFYQEKLNTGLSFLVFPDISLAVELSKPVLVRWEGDKMKHCTITVNKGITIQTSSFPFRNQVIPQVYNSNRISHKEAFKMITKGSKLQRKNIPGLTYHPDEAPTGCCDFLKNTAAILSLGANDGSTVCQFPRERWMGRLLFKCLHG